MIAAAGIDSWSPCWYVDRDGPLAGQLDELATVPSARGRLLPRPVAGHRVGWNRSAGMVYAEGHPCGAMPGEWDVVPFDLTSEERQARVACAIDREAWLVSPGRLGMAYTGLVEALGAHGLHVPASVWAEQREADFVVPGKDPLPGFAGLRRCDATVDVDAGSSARGLAILAGVAGVATAVPRAQAEVRFAKDGTGSIETVYLRGHGGVKVLGRWYDKGLESGCAPRGRVIRAEDQRRYPKGHRRDIRELEASYVKSKFQQRWLSLWQATKGVTVAGTMVIAERLADKVQDGQVTAKQAEALIGYVVMSRRGVKQGRSTVYNRRKRLRELGLVVADGVLEEVEVDLHEVLEEALESPAWGAQG